MSIAEHAEALPAVGSRVPSGAGGRATSATLVGRGVELNLLVEMLAVVPSVAVVEGEAGIGKTRLVAEFTNRLHSDNGDGKSPRRRVLLGGCRRIREPFPLGSVIEALRGLGDELAGVRFSPVVGALRPLLPELADWFPLTPDPLDDRAAERHRVFRGLVELLNALGPAVLVLEDCHWADEHSVEFLAYLLSSMPEGLSVVLTYRSEEVNPEVRTATSRLSPDVRHAAIELHPLDTEQTGTLAASLLDTDHVSHTFSEHLYARASGVPLAIEELVALLRARGSLVQTGGVWARKAINELDVPAGIRDPVLERVHRMSEPARLVVEAAAVLQEEVPLSVLLGVCDASHHVAARGVDEALSSGLLVERGDTIGFRHVLAAQAVYDSLTGPRRTELHGRSVAALKKLDPAPLGLLAHHLRHAGRLEEWADVAEHAASLAVELGHHEEAARLLEDVLRNAPLDAGRRGRVLVECARAAGEMLYGLQAVDDVLSAVLECDIPRPMRGELRFWLAMATERAGGDLARKRWLYAGAVDDLDDRPELQAWAMAGLAIGIDPDVSIAEQRMWIQRLRDVIPRVRDPARRVHLLSKVAMTQVLVGEPSWLSVAEHIETHVGEPSSLREITAYHSIGEMACVTGHYRAANRLLLASLAGAVASESKLPELNIRAAFALLEYCRGNWNGLDQQVVPLLDELAEYPLARVDVEIAAGAVASLAATWKQLGDASVSSWKTSTRWVGTTSLRSRWRRWLGSR